MKYFLQTCKKWSPFFILLSLTLTVFTQPTDSYHNYRQMTQVLNQIAVQNAAFTRLVSLGQSRGQRDIWLLTLSDFRSRQPDKKPALLVVANLEGNQVVGSELVLQAVEEMLRKAKAEAAVRQLLKHTTIYFIPRLNPDGAERMFAPLKWESENNTTPIDDDNDGAADEDPGDDLNGDGLITAMRIKEPGGQYLPDPREPRVLKNADPAKNEKGEYKILLEGKDNDGDLEINEDLEGGVDLNRNFPIGYQYFATGSGIFPVSEKESRALADFLVAHKNITAIFTFSGNDNLVHPPKKPSKAAEKRRTEDSGSFLRQSPVTKIDAKDQPLYQYFSEEYKKIVGITSLPVRKEVKGSFSDYGYFGWGIVSLANPGWTIPQGSSAEVKKEQPKGKTSDSRNEEKDAAALDLKYFKWLEESGVDGFVNWQRVQHPDFPDRVVEVGGFKPFVKTNPPAKMVAEFAPRQAEFFLEILKLFPQVKIESFKIVKKDNGVVEIKAIVQNTGFLPTNTALGAKMRLNRPTKVELKLNGQRLLSGRRLNFVKQIAGAGGTATFLWTIQGQGNISLVVDSPRGGQVSTSLKL